MRCRRKEVAVGSADGAAVPDAAKLVDEDVDCGRSASRAESRRWEGSEE